MKIIKVSQSETEIPEKLWHISNTLFKKFNTKVTPQGILWFSKDKNILIADGQGANIRSSVPTYLYEVITTAKNPANWDQYERYGIWELKREGFDSIDLEDTFVIFNNDDIHITKVTKS